MGPPALRRSVALVLFFLRTSYFRPACNPVLPVAGVFLLFFQIEGSLDRYHVVLLLFLTAIAHALTGNLFGDTREARARGIRSPLERWFRPLPVTGGQVFLAYLAASLLYGILVFLLFSFLLHQKTRLPDFSGGEMVRLPTGEGDTVTVFRGFARTPRGILYPASVVIERSLFFDALARFGAARPVLGAYYVILFVYVAALQGLGPLRLGRLRRALLFTPLALYLASGLVLFAELLLMPRDATYLVRRLAEREEALLVVVGAVLLATVAATVATTRTVLARLSGRSP